jgi:hypothetical protein
MGPRAAEFWTLAFLNGLAAGVVRGGNVGEAGQSSIVRDHAE